MTYEGEGYRGRIPETRISHFKYFCEEIKSVFGFRFYL
jgi:hypothetical protein